MHQLKRGLSAGEPALTPDRLTPQALDLPIKSTCTPRHPAAPAWCVLAPSVSVRPVGRESSWNVDGELLSDNTVSVQVQRALVDVFSRSIEMPR